MDTPEPDQVHRPKKPARTPGGGAALPRGESGIWLLCTFLQALLTWAFIGISTLSEGWPWERQAKLLVVVAILATWGMALRTIRARLVELARIWHAASKGLLQKASESGLHQIPMALKGWQARYVNRSILRLRIIAAGITMPFFVLPAFTAAACLSLCWCRGSGEPNLLGLAVFASVLTAIVGVYFHWSILPPAAPVRVDARTRPAYPLRARRKKGSGLR